MKWILAFGIACLAAQGSERTVSRVSSLQVRADGKFDVICSGGTFEIAAVEDIAANRVCGVGPAPMPLTGMRSAIRKNEGTFEILCSDGSVETHATSSLVAGMPCFSVGKTVLGGGVSGGATATLPANAVLFIPFETKTAMKVTGWGFGTAVQRDPQVVMGIYTSYEGKPQALVASSEVFDVDAPKLYLVGAKGESLEAGKYFLAAQSNASLTIGGRALSGSSYAHGKVSVPFTGKLPNSINPADYQASTLSVVPQIFALAK